MWKIDTEISDYPSDYKLRLEFSGMVASFYNEVPGEKIISFDISVDELIRAGEWAKKFKEATSCTN